jgi:hypothetical protein
MTYEEFLTFVPRKCMYETIYEDSDGRDILVIKMLDAYGMVNKAQRKWQGLTDEELLGCAVFKHFDYDPPYINKDGVKFVASHEVSLRATYENINAKLKEKNT